MKFSLLLIDVILYRVYIFNVYARFVIHFVIFLIEVF